MGHTCENGGLGTCCDLFNHPGVIKAAARARSAALKKMRRHMFRQSSIGARLVQMAQRLDDENLSGQAHWTSAQN